MRSPLTNEEFWRGLAEIAWRGLERVPPEERDPEMLDLVASLRAAARLDDDHGIFEAPDLAGEPLIARRLRSLRGASRMTQARLAEEFGVDKRELARWERGAPIPPEIVPLLADRFAISIPFFLGEC